MNSITSEAKYRQRVIRYSEKHGVTNVRARIRFFMVADLQLQLILLSGQIVDKFAVFLPHCCVVVLALRPVKLCPPPCTATKILANFIDSLT